MQDNQNYDCSLISTPKAINSIRLGTAIIFFVHFCIAVYYKIIVGVNIEYFFMTWDWFWQTLPLELLKTNMIESIWNLHSQPPLHNLFGAFLVKLFDPHHLQYMHYWHIILGSLLSAMLYIIILRLTGNNIFSFIIALVLCLNPSLFLYEAFALYILPTAFWVITSLFFLSMFSIKKRVAYIYAFIFSLNALILIRSIYHIIILLVGIPFACVLAHKQWRKVLIISVLISLTSLTWYGKNYFKFGFFGASSLMGSNLYRIARINYSNERLTELAEAKIIQSIILKRAPFSKPSEYMKYGFDKTSSVKALANDDYNNINFIAISKMYQVNAIELILHDPLHYLRNIMNAYMLYCQPSSRYEQIHHNAVKIKSHETISSEIFQGLALTNRFPNMMPFMFYLLPVFLLFYLIMLVINCRVSVSKWFNYIQIDAVMLFAVFVIIYTTVISCSFEFGENGRFKFLVEQVLWAFIISCIYRFSHFIASKVSAS